MRLLADHNLTDPKYARWAKDGILRRTKGDNVDRQTRKCLHRLRTILSPPRTASKAPVACGGRSAWCTQSVIPSEEEVKLCRRLCPRLPLATLAAKIAKVSCALRDAAKEPLPPRPAMTCTNPQCDGRDECLVFDAVSADTVCSNCGMVCVSQDAHAWQTVAPVNQPMYSEPIKGHINAQQKADFYCGMHGDATTSNYTKFMDIQHMSNWYQSHMPEALASRATQVYSEYRRIVDHVQQKDAIAMACTIVARRSMHGSGNNT